MSKERFEDFKINKQILSAIKDLGFKKPTPVQVKVIPLALAGHDLMGVAQTGTGKTAAFAIPLIMKLKYAQGDDPRGLILAPTRELVIQIEKHLKELSSYTDLRIVSLYGGVGPSGQIEKINSGVDLVVATPGRLMDIYFRNKLVLKNIKTLVIDEADRMMDMGFMPQIRKILEIIPVKRQNMLFSATMPDKVLSLSEEFLEFPEKVEVTPQATAAETIEQILYKAPNLKTKISLLEYLISNKEISKALIFTRTKTIADNVYKFLERKKLGPVRVIHSNKGQNTRLNAIQAFEKNDINILVSTDVSARGIDISDVSHVINFDVPLLYEDYVHRIGRTGRALKEGQAITMANKAELMHIEEIEKLIRQKIPVIDLPNEVERFPTGAEERKEIEREIDRIRRRRDPEFKGAFHEKKNTKGKKKKR